MSELTNDEIEELVGLKDVDKNMLKTRKNGLLLTDNQVATLERNGIDPSKATTMTELLYMIEQVDDDDDDTSALDEIADQLAETNYYQNTRK